MSYKLIIVESPGKVKSISKFLGKNYRVQASAGHIRDLPKSHMGIDIEDNFNPKYITIRGKGELLSKLKKEAKGADKIYLATDPDREGEAISWHLAYLLNIEEKSKCRITFNEITKNAVTSALKNPREIDLNLVNAQQARRILDRIVGYKISPLLWRNIKKGLSAGRVQSVAVRLICDREEEIENFIPEEYWTIVANLTKKEKGSKAVFKAKFYGAGNKKIELKNKEQVDEILSKIDKQDFIVSKVKKGERRKSPSPPFITSTMQQEAARKLGFTTKKTMMVAQQLYEGIEIKGQGSVGLITYMRTDSTRISNEALQDVRSYITDKYGTEYVPEKPRIFKNKSSSQDAHEAIRPSNVLLTPDDLKESLNRDQLRLYKLIWERFVACQMSPAVFDTLNVDISVQEYLFKVSGSRIKFPGYHVVYKESKDETNSDENEEENANLPEFEEGDILVSKKIESQQNFTQPPPRYTEASLVRALEEKGIGRPSTYAPIISTIISRNYIVRESKLLYPTELGKIVTDVMKKHFGDIVDVTFTAQVEDELDKIEEGEKDWVQVLDEFYKGFDITVKQAEQSIGNIEIPDEVTDVICEKCGKNMVIKMGRYGKFLACPGFPDCRNTKPIVEEAGVSCPKCKGKVLIKKTRKGRKYYACENNPQCDFMSWDKPTGENCPQCGNYLISKFSRSKNMTQVKCGNEKCTYVVELKDDKE